MSNKYFKDLDINIVDESKTFASFTIQPFERGYGVTIGNALRRTILTSLPGAAITSIKIDGVSHEFSTIKGVADDTSDIILNLKKVRFKMLNDDANSELVNFEITGPSIFKAGDFNQFLNDFEVLNKDEEIFTITDKSKLFIEIRVSRGKGYLPSHLNKRPDDSLGTISIDSIFNPIKNVSWEIQPIAASTEEQEKLLIKVTSDGSTTPKDAVNHAAKIMHQHLAYFMFDDANAIKAVNSEALLRLSLDPQHHAGHIIPCGSSPAKSCTAPIRRSISASADKPSAHPVRIVSAVCSKPKISLAGLAASMIPSEQKTT